MKSFRLNFLIVLFIFCSITICPAQYNVIKLDVLGLIIPTMPVFRPSYERNIGKYYSLMLNFETGVYSTGTSEKVGAGIQEQYSLKGWGFMPEFRVYPFGKRKDAPIGFFFGTYIRQRGLHETYSGKDYDIPDNNNNGYPPVPPSYVNIKTKGSLTDLGLSFGYKAKAGPIIFEPLIGYGIGAVSGFSEQERSKIDPFFTEGGINSPWNRLRIQFSMGFIFNK